MAQLAGHLSGDRMDSFCEFTPSKAAASNAACHTAADANHGRFSNPITPCPFSSSSCPYFSPPVAVLLHKGAGKDFVINFLLTLLLFWLGGVIHALYLVLKTPKA